MSYNQEMTPNLPFVLTAPRNIVKNYPGVRAVDHATLELLPGEVHGLVGENGAGKSTLIKILAGAVRKDGGELFLNGELVTINNVQDAYRLGLAFIHQELNLVPYFDGVENIFLGHAYPRQRWGGMDRKRLHQRAAAILTATGRATAGSICRSAGSRPASRR